MRQYVTNAKYNGVTKIGLVAHNKAQAEKICKAFGHNLKIIDKGDICYHDLTNEELFNKQLHLLNKLYKEGYLNIYENC